MCFKRRLVNLSAQEQYQEYYEARRQVDKGRGLDDDTGKEVKRI
jgi:hypothetical protein